MREVLWLSLQQVAQTFLHTWPFLAAGIAIAAASRLLVSPERIAALFRRRRAGAVVLATGAAVATPLCSCGTMAVILGMLASAVPWAPVVAFMVASPLTSPQELVLSAGLFGWPFAGAFFAASVALGLLGGAAAAVLESRGWLDGQARQVMARAPSTPAARPRGGKLAAALAREAWTGTRKLVPLFFAFAFIGYLLNNLIPARWIGAAFGRGSLGVPLAATLGLPLYVNTEASLPLVRAFIDHGATAGAALAFLITGAGTSIGAIAGAFTIARWRVIGVVVATLWVGALAAGYAYDAVGGTVSAVGPALPSSSRMERDLSALTAPDAAGRLSGTPGAAQAAKSLAHALREAGFAPAGEGGYFQPVEVPAARLTGPMVLRVGERVLVPRVEFTALRPLSSAGSVRAPLLAMGADPVRSAALDGRVVLLADPPADLDVAATAQALAGAGSRALLIGSSAPVRKSVYPDGGRIPVLAVRAEVAAALARQDGENVVLDLPLEVAARPCNNVLGLLRGSGSGSGGAVLLSAHYDHVGDDPGGTAFPGAFDNASGVAAVLEAARRLASGPRLPFDVLVALTTGEESGLWGMRALLANPPEPIAAAITLDGVGAPPGLSRLRLGQREPGDALGALAAQVVREGGIEPLWIEGTDDSAALRAAGIPTVGLGQEPAAGSALPLHTAQDTLAALDRAQVATSAALLVAVVQRLAERGLPLQLAVNHGRASRQEEKGR